MAKNMLSVFIALALMSLLADAGSPCPDRDMLYPCHCVNVPMAKKNVFTVVTCRHVPQTDSLALIRTLRTMQIDRFVIYDSFWEVEKLGGDLDLHRRLPENMLSTLQITDLEIIDTHLSDNFGCNSKSCANKAIKHMTLRNSSSADTIKTLCTLDSKKFFFWTSCLNRLETFTFIYNQLKTFGKGVFPDQMQSLITLNLSHNHIQTIEENAFVKLVKLHSLDLSHNEIENLPKNMFGTEKTVIGFLDLSYNMLKSLPSDVFAVTPYLVTFVASGNMMEQLPQDEWKCLGDKIKLIDLKDNPIVCDCHMIWINCTLHVNTLVVGFCSNEGYLETPLRRASIYMSERCDENNVIQERLGGNKRNACVGFTKNNCS